jgi:hypothetical protein
MSVEVLNGTARRELMIILDGSRAYIGQPYGADDGGFRTLSQVFEIQRAIVARPSVQRHGATDIQIPTMVLPVSGLISLERLTFSVTTPVVRVRDLERREASDIERAYAQCEDLVRTLRADLAGVRPALVVPG